MTATRCLSRVFRKPLIQSARNRAIMTSPSVSEIPPSVLMEEETMPGYKASEHYPVRMQQTFQDRYRVKTKLGYGSASTVWLCRDVIKSRDVALKIYIHNSKANRELPIYEHINQVQSKSGGPPLVRQLFDSFEIQGPDGKHVCLVHELKGRTLQELKDMLPNKVFNPYVLRYFLRRIVAGLEFLHKEAHIIHTDLQLNNMLMGIHDYDAVLAKFEKENAKHPLPQKHLGDRTIYVSSRMPFTKEPPSISDLSEARFGDVEHRDLIMPDVYRAPEVVLGMKWSYPVDIWGFAMIVWDLFEPKRLFRPKDEKGHYSEQHHLAQMVAIMGPPPLDFLQRSERSQLYWDSKGNWKGEVKIPETGLEAAEQRLDGERKTQFLAWIRKMLQWKPDDRGNWDDVFWDEWFLADLIESGEVKTINSEN